jgi:ribosomal protein S18 acetylase RimI-like enzyme
MIRMLQPASIPAAARLLAGSMRDNPLHQRVFGGDGARLEPLLEGAFARLLRTQLRTGLVLGAFDEDEALVGVAAMVPPGHCQPGLQEKLAMLPVLARGGALRRLPRIAHWLRTWARHDPVFDHWHLGPAAVDRSRQGQGVGTRLMAAICDRLDREQGVGYLETDKPENVRLYRRGGFEVVAEQPILGVTNWFMQRQPVPQGGQARTIGDNRDPTGST